MPQLLPFKEELCDVGRRIYAKGFASAHDGNMSYRISDDRVLCTPTQICKGFMKPNDICVVDMDGAQISGHRKMTSEILLHLTIMKRRPGVNAVVHCHPPHATAFGIAREAIPRFVLPEVELHIGEVPIAKYAIPGGQALADTILGFIEHSNVMILANHGTVSVGNTVEAAYWLTELLDGYCRTLLLAKQLGRVEYFSQQEADELAEMKGKMGLTHDGSEEYWERVQKLGEAIGVGHRAFLPPSYS